MSRSLVSLIGSQAKAAAVAAAALALGAGGALAATTEPASSTTPVGVSDVSPDTTTGALDLDDDATDETGTTEDAESTENPQGSQEGEATEDTENGEDTETGDGAVPPACPEGVTSHGQYVSSIARDRTTSEDYRNHGERVSEAARTGCVVPDSEIPEDAAPEEDTAGTAAAEEDAAPAAGRDAVGSEQRAAAAQKVVEKRAAVAAKKAAVADTVTQKTSQKDRATEQKAVAERSERASTPASEGTPGKGRNRG